MAQTQPTEMVLLQEETSSSTRPTGGCRRGDMGGKSNHHPQNDSSSAENLPSGLLLRGIRVTLDNNSMWKEFFRCRTEMIITKQGSRMFPYCRFRIVGLNPNRKYSLLMDIQPVDTHTYRWSERSWHVCGKAEHHTRTPPFAHPESPASGQHWMQNPISFYRLKLTSDVDDQAGNTVLRPNQRYLPRLHIAATDRPKDVKLSAAGVVTFTFPQTEFMAVTAYQNTRFTQLKVEYNPFAKGLKEEAGAKGLLKVNTKESAPEQNPLKKSLKSLLANHKPKSSKPAETHPENYPESRSDTFPESRPETRLEPKPPKQKDTPKPSKDRSTPCSKDQSAAKPPTEQTCNNPRPTQKLFSERIREAHVALQRCNLSQYEVGEVASQQTSQNGSKDNDRDATKGQTKAQTLKTYSRNTEKSKKDTVVLIKDNTRTDVSKENKPLASTASNSERKLECPSDAKVSKRPATLPLSALGLFLKQHSAKSKKAKTDIVKETDSVKEQTLEPCSKLECKKRETTLELSKKAEDVTETEQSEQNIDVSKNKATLESCKPDDKLEQSSATSKRQKDAEVDRTLEHILKKDNLYLEESEPETHSTEEPVPDPHLGESNTNGTLTDSVSEPLTLAQAPSQESQKKRKKPKPRKKSKWHKPKPKQAAPAISTLQSVPEMLPSESSPPSSTNTEPTKDFPNDVPKVDHIVDSALSEQEQQNKTEPFPVDPSSGKENMDSNSTVLQNSPPPFCTLPTISSPFAASSSSQLEAVLPISATASLPTDSSLLPDGEGFGFEPLSPASSPEPLPTIPESLAFDLEPSEIPNSSEPQNAATKPESSVFKWHTVLPLPEQCLPSPFSPFPTSPVPQIPPTVLESHPETSVPVLPTEPAVVFQESEQVLPFPGDLSPLALQFPVSPTFSSLDGDALSPTDLTELVHFFAAADDLGIGVSEFSNSAGEERADQTTPAETSANVEPQIEEPSEQARPVQTFTIQKKSKKKKKRGPSKVDLDLDSVQQDPSYSVMKPNLEEVEEQLFISFTSKEALELHLGDSPENSQTEALTSTDTVHNVSTGERKTSACEQNEDNPPLEEVSLQKQCPDPSSPVTSLLKDGDEETTTRKQNKQEEAALYTPAEETTEDTAVTQGNPESKSPRSTILHRDHFQDLPQDLPTKRPHRDQYSDRHLLQSVEFEEKISELEQILLKDVKLMKHKQVIHPVLQEVGLKMALLDPNLPIDLQYLGIPLPLPPPRASQEPDPVDTGVSSAFVSRTGKTKDVTQIKGWRDKFTSEPTAPPEAPPVPEPPQKKNLSAFCSDMLDEYLEMEGKLIDERASSFTAPDPAPVTYDLPTHSSSYVRTLTSVLKANDSNTSELISGFVPPSKRPKLPPANTKLAKKTFKYKKKLAGKDETGELSVAIQETPLSGAKKLKKLQKLNKERHSLKAVFGFDDKTPTIHLNKTLPTLEENEEPEPDKPGDKTNSSFGNESTADSYDFDFTEPLSHAPNVTKKPKKNKLQNQLKDVDDNSNSSKWSNSIETLASGDFDFDHTEPISEPPDFEEFSPRRRKRRRRRRSDSVELELMAPLESDSELCAEETEEKPAKPRPASPASSNQKVEKAAAASQNKPLVTKALVKQRDLEQRAFWEGKGRTCVTQERAMVALSALFTLKGFVAEDPHLPVRLTPHRAPRCLNDFCRLGCMCSSLTHIARTAHCRRALCMFRCTCLKQKVVLLRNLDQTDSPAARPGAKKKKRRRRRMKMAYVLKEAETVSQPASPVRRLWVQTRAQDPERDPEALSAPPQAAHLRRGMKPPAPAEQLSFRRSTEQVVTEEGQSCARVKTFSELKPKPKKPKPAPDSAPPVLRDRENLRSPDLATPSEPSVETQTCARIRAFVVRSPKKPPKEKNLEKPGDSVKPTTKTADSATRPASASTAQPAVASTAQPAVASSAQPAVPPARTSSKRLVLLANCKWQNEGDRVAVLKVLCEAMTLGKLEQPFWIGPYFISPFKPTVSQRDGKYCTEVKVHISTPKAYISSPDEKKGTEEEKKETTEERKQQPQEEPQPHRSQNDAENDGAEETMDWSRDQDEPELSEPEDREAGPVQKEAGPVHKEVEKVEPAVEKLTPAAEKGEPPVKEVESDDLETQIENLKREEQFFPVLDGVTLALPFLRGISPAGFLTGSVKGDFQSHPIMVNGKPYPLAKVQLGRMGALHPANRLAAYLTGRVGGAIKSLSSSSPVTPTTPPTSAPNVASANSATFTTTTAPAVTATTTLTTLGINQTTISPGPVTVAPKVIQSTAVSMSGLNAGLVSEGSQLQTSTVSQGLQVKVHPSSKSPQVLMIQVPGPNSAPVPVLLPMSSSPLTFPPLPPASSASRPILQASPLVQKQTMIAPHIPTPARTQTPPRLPMTSPRLPQTSPRLPLTSPRLPLTSPRLPQTSSRMPQTSPRLSLTTSPRLHLTSQPAAGVRFFRKPDGKLVQLIPVSQKQASPNGGAKNVTVYQAVNTVVPLCSNSLPVKLTPVPVNSAPTGVSGLQTFNISSSSTSVNHKSGLSFTILPGKSNTEKVVVRTAEAVPPAPKVTIVPQTSVAPVTPVESTVTVKQEPPAAEEEKDTVGSAGQELAMDENDLDVICVVAEDRESKVKEVVVVDSSSEVTEDSSDYNSSEEIRKKRAREARQRREQAAQKKMVSETVAMREEGKTKRTEEEEQEDVVVVDSSTDEAEQSFDDRRTSEAKEMHNFLEKVHRQKMNKLFHALRRTIGENKDQTSKISILNKAQTVIKGLTATEARLRNLKSSLRTTRDGLLNQLLPFSSNPEMQSLLRESRQSRDEITERVDLNSKREEPGHKETNQFKKVTDTKTIQQQLRTVVSDIEQRRELSLDEEKACDSLSSVLDVDEPEKPQLIEKACAELSSLHTQSQRLYKKKERLRRQQERLQRELSSFSEKSPQNQPDQLQPANQTPAQTVTSSSPTKSSSLTSQTINLQQNSSSMTSSPTKVQTATVTSSTVKAPPLHVITSSAPPLQTVTSSAITLLIAQNPPMRHKTVPNILSRSRTSNAASSKEGPAAAQMVQMAQVVQAQAPVQTLIPSGFMMSSSAPLPAPVFQRQVLPKQQLIPAQVVPPSQQVAPPPQVPLQVVTLRPVLQTSPAMKTVALNVPANQQLSSGPHPSSGEQFTCSMPFTISNFKGGSLSLVVSPQHLPSAPAPPLAPPLNTTASPVVVNPPLTVATAVSDAKTTTPTEIKTTEPPFCDTAAKTTPSGLQLPSAPAPQTQTAPSTQTSSSPTTTTKTTDPPSLPPPPAPTQTPPPAAAPVQSVPPSSSSPPSSSLTSLLDEIAFLNQNSNTSANQNASPAVPPPPLVKLSKSSTATAKADTANPVAGGGTWRPMPKLRRRL